MNKQKWIILIVALGLMGGAASVLTRLQANQKLGRPAVKTSPIAGSQRLQVELPERALDYTSEAVEVDKATLEWLPQDTSFGQRLYRAPDGFYTAVNVVLMGSDRTSLHKTEFCLEGQGWQIDRSATAEAKVRMERPYPYDLPVMKFIATRDVKSEGRTVTVRGVYVVWFVAEDEYTARHWQRMWWMARDLLCTGVLQRWASVSFFAQCAPGAEDATFERMKKLIGALVPEFQLVPRPEETVGVPRPKPGQ
ncbi:MAG TPA: exosortase-associated EpsI family protein [Candidatus Paceibacterota bacterium]|nr:exosortase-associated EpsI family protein [Verrucomicrobiota bacterium]HSA11110.1 exosortase-associated EpsI family protein [Candidatus Paceibacterota bacterium]